MSRLRIDRAATLGVAQPLRRMLKRPRNCGIPVLMYHGIRSVAGSSHPYFETSTSPSVFARHMSYLHDNGYKPVSLDLAAKMIGSKACLQKTVAITFDDGFRDFYTNALPILREYQFPATMFIVSDFVGSRQVRFADREFMTWNEIREVESSSITIGSHTVSHPRLHNLLWEDIERELKNSKQVIEDKLGKPVNTFSHPYAFPEQDRSFLVRLRQYMSAAGYHYGVTTVVGSANHHCDQYFLPRLPSNDYDDDGLFEAKLKGSYDWLHIPQLIYKFIRNRNHQEVMENVLANDRDRKPSWVTEQ